MVTASSRWTEVTGASAHTLSSTPDPTAKSVSYPCQHSLALYRNIFSVTFCFITGVFPTPATNPPPPTTPPPPPPTTTFEPTTTTEMEVMVGDLGLPDMILVQSLVGPVNTGPTILDVFDLNPGSTSFSLLRV